MSIIFTSKFPVRTVISRVNSSIFTRNVMGSVFRVQKAMEELEENPYYKKYAEKIAKLQKTSPEEFLNRIEKRKGLKKEQKPKERQFSALLPQKKPLSEPKYVPDESLDKIMKVDLIKDKTADEIKTIWEQYHLQKEFIAATIPAEQYDVIVDQSERNPIFLFPIPRGSGYEFIMSVFEGRAVHFTPLICYQVYKENALECLTIKHYTEFKDDKGVVLMRGEYDKNVISAKEAQCLANLLQLYYGRMDAEKTKLLEAFTRRPKEFKHDDLIKEIENISLQ